MVSTCFLCKWRGDKLPRRSYHKFPLNKELKQKWLDILGKSNVSLGKRASLCSLHFEEDCFRYGLVYGTKILKEGSLPTLHLNTNNTENETINSVNEIKLKPETESSSHIHHPVTDDTDNFTLAYLCDVQINDATSELNIEAHQIEENQIKTSTSELEVPIESSNDATSELNIEDHQIEENQIKTSTSELEVPIESSPNESARKSSSLDGQLEKEEILRLKKKVWTLQRSVKRLRNSKSKLKSRLIEMKKKVHKCEAEKKLMRSKLGPIPQALYEQLKSSKKKVPSYSTPLRVFASTVSNLSPEAYAYVKKVFPALPHAATLRKWKPGICKKSPAILEKK